MNQLGSKISRGQMQKVGIWTMDLLLLNMEVFDSGEVLNGGGAHS